VTFRRKISAVSWQACCSGELYDWQTSHHRVSVDAIRFAGLCRPGAAALAKFVTGKQQRSRLWWWTELRSELGWPELGWRAAVGRPGSAGTGARASFGWIPPRLATIGSPLAGSGPGTSFGWIPLCLSALRSSAAGSPTTFAAGSRPSSAVRRQSGTALGITANGTASNPGGSRPRRW